MVDENELRTVVGKADACELLAAAAPFPTEELARGLAEGTLAADTRGCLEDCGIAPDEAADACAAWNELVGCDADALLGKLRRAHSLLFMRQGDGVAVWPYESAFRHVVDGKDGEPALFRAPITLAVEGSMRDAGVLPENSRVEPCDSIWSELSFLSYAIGSEAAALTAEDEEGAALWRERSERFVGEHALRWLPAFFEAVSHALPVVVDDDEARTFYAGLSAYGLRVMELLTEH